MIKKYIIKKELNLEFRNNSSLFLITPTMCVLIIVFPILSENRFRVENDIFVIVQLLFLIIFTTLFSIRNPMEEQALIKELNFGTIKKIDYFYSKTVAELGIFYPQIILLLILFSGFTNTSINNSNSWPNGAISTFTGLKRLKSVVKMWSKLSKRCKIAVR